MEWYVSVSELVSSSITSSEISRSINSHCVLISDCAVRRLRRQDSSSLRRSEDDDCGDECILRD